MQPEEFITVFTEVQEPFRAAWIQSTLPQNISLRHALL
jgi:hypothetical protein